MSETNSPTPKGLMEKIEFYFIGLAFTLLGLAIQSFKTTQIFKQDFLETSGWLLLLSSGLIGLWKLEWLPILLHVENEKADKEQIVDQLRKIASQGIRSVKISNENRTAEITEVASLAESSLNKIKDHSKKLGKRHGIKHATQKYLFIIGISSIFLARSYPVVKEILKTMKII